MACLDDDAYEVRYPVKCPSCHTAAPILKSATPVEGYPEIIRLDLRCAACPHNWIRYTRHTDPPI